MAIIYRMVDTWYRVEDALHNQDPRKKPCSYKSKGLTPSLQAEAKKFNESQRKDIRENVLSYIENLKKEITVRSKEPNTNMEKSIQQLEGELNYFSNNMEEIINQVQLLQLEHLLVFFEDEDNSKLYVGAQGELKVVEELKKLPNSYHLINNFYYDYEYGSSKYKKDAKKRIYTGQIDHIVIGTTGVFVIETKNWRSDYSDQSSPEDQVSRHGLALWSLINSQVSSLPSFKHSRIRKIYVHDMLCWAGKKPDRKYEHIIMCTPEELRRIIQEEHTPVFNDDQIRELVDYLLYLCNGMQDSDSVYNPYFDSFIQRQQF